ncbi:unnamed protein product [Rangifer tarandus platyrhynchus]|uniref:Uncharacterized protein n=2 Tax=Rangifer tarandus platyrhynchus TaxID=3082113 RepID=A0AC59YRI4_RANTA
MLFKGEFLLAGPGEGTGSRLGAGVQSLEATLQRTHSSNRTRPSAAAVAAALPRHPERYESGWVPRSPPPPPNPGRSPVAGAPCRAPAPPVSNLRADGSMICAQAGAAKGPGSTLLPTLLLLPRGSIVSLGRAATRAGQASRVATPVWVQLAHRALLPGTERNKEAPKRVRGASPGPRRPPSGEEVSGEGAERPT